MTQQPRQYGIVGARLVLVHNLPPQSLKECVLEVSLRSERHLSVLPDYVPDLHTEASAILNKGVSRRVRQWYSDERQLECVRG
jgi:hypothetical protein